MIIDVTSIPHADAYKLIIGSVVPRPIAFVSTRSRDGIDNLAPFSFFTAVCANPLTICFSPMRKGPTGVKKDTLVNIEETGEFVVNMVDEAFAEAMNLCSMEFAPGISEFAASGLTPLPSEVVAPPRVGESPISLECHLQQVIEVGSGPGSGALVLGTVLRFHVRNDLYEEGRIRLDRWHPIARLAGMSYARVTDVFDMPRPAMPMGSQPG